jgi:autotransporter-associated beta strand protein
MRHSFIAILNTLLLGLIAGTAQAQLTIVKANNTTALNATGSWTNGVVPGAIDTALWNNIVLGANSSALGGNVTWGQITISNPGGAITIANTASATLTLNGVSGTGIDMSSASQNLTINNPVTLGASQTWNVGASRTLTVGSAIGEVSSGYGITKSGTGALTLSGNNTFSGGTVLNAGTLNTTADSNLGIGGGITVNGAVAWNWGASVNYARALTVNEDAVLTLNQNGSNTGLLSGNGTITVSGSVGPIFSNTGSTFTGTVNLGYGMTLGNLGDSSNPINFSNGYMYWTGGAKTFALRPFTLSATGTATLSNNGSGALTIQQPLAITGAGARTLTLGYSSSYTASANQFAGNIADGPGSVVSLTKGGDSSIWALSGSNTYSGATTTVCGGNPNNGFLIFQGIQAFPTNTSLNLVQVNANSAPSGIKILDDSASPASRSAVSLIYSNDQNNATDQRVHMSLFVGNNSTANGGTSSGTQMGSTIQLGNFNITQASIGQTTGAGLAVFGANGYKLQIANVGISLAAAYASAWPVILNATNNALIVTGNVQQVAGSGGRVALQLSGSAPGCLISGNILDSADGTPKVLTLTKAGTGDWTLSGSNTYTGATSINGGALRVTTGSGTRCASAITITNTAGCLFGVQVAAVDGQWVSSSTLTVAGASSEIEIDYGSTAPSTTVDPVQVPTLTVTAPGKLKILSSDISQLVAGTYPLINFTTSGPADATGWTLTLPTGVTGNLSVVGNHLNLVITGNTPKSWNSADADWDTGTPWTLAGTPVAFVANDTVYLGDASGVSGNPTLTVSGSSVSPTAVIMNSANHDYTITGNSIAAGTVTVNTPSRTLTLSGANTYTGATTIIKGTLKAGVATVPGTSGAFGNTSAVTFTNDPTAVLDLNGFNNTIASLSGGGALGGTVVLGSATLTTGGNNANTTYAGVLSGSGGLTKTGSGKLILTGNSTYTGATTISVGTLQIGINGTANGAKLGNGNYAGNIFIASGATLDVQTDANQTLSGVISGDGSIVKRYIGTLTLSGNNTYTGKTSITPLTTASTPALSVASFNSVNGGTPLLASSSLGCPTNVTNGTIDFGSGTAQNTCQLNYTGPGETTDRVINFNQNGNGGRIIDTGSGGGLLKFTSTSTGNSGTCSITLQGASNGEFVGGLPFAFLNFTKSGTGTWTLSGTNAYTGATTVNGGTLLLNGGAVTNSGVLTVGSSVNNASLVLTNGARFFAGGGTHYVGYRSSYNTMTVAGGTGVSTFNGGGQALEIAHSRSTVAQGDWLTIGAGGVVTNVTTLSVGVAGDFSSSDAASNQVAVTDGGQLFLSGALKVGLNWPTGNDHCSATSNTMVIANRGVVRSGGEVYVGTLNPGSGNGSASWSFNSLTITNGGQLYSNGTTTSYIGRVLSTYTTAKANSNTVTIAGSLNGTNSLWDLGGKALHLGYTTNASSAIGNVLRVNAGGVATNISSLRVSATNTLSLGAGGLVYASAVTNAGTMTVGLDDSQPAGACGRLTVTGALDLNNVTLNFVTNGVPAGSAYVIASYGSLTGSFAATNGLPGNYFLDMNYRSLNQIAISGPADGTLIFVQ